MPTTQAVKLIYETFNHYLKTARLSLKAINYLGFIIFLPVTTENPGLNRTSISGGKKANEATLIKTSNVKIKKQVHNLSTR